MQHLQGRFQYQLVCIFEKIYLIDCVSQNYLAKGYADTAHGVEFPEGYEPFAEKNAHAKEKLSKIKLPEGLGSK